MLRLIGVLLILGGLAGGILYVQSDPFRTKVDRVVDEWTTWTPENIAKDPKGYLTFALVELEKIKDRLQAHKLDLRVRRDLAAEKLKTEDMNVRASNLALERLKDAYRAADRGYPVSVEGRTLDADAFQERVVEVDRLLTAAKENSEQYGQYIAHLEGELSRTEAELKKLAEKRQFVQQRLDHLKLDLEMGSVDELTSKATEIATYARNLKPTPSKSAAEAQNLVASAKKELQGLSARERFEQIMTGSK